MSHRHEDRGRSAHLPQPNCQGPFCQKLPLPQETLPAAQRVVVSSEFCVALVNDHTDCLSGRRRNSDGRFFDVPAGHPLPIERPPRTARA